MVFIRKKIINGNEYLYEQKSVRENGKVVSKHIKYHGKSVQGFGSGATHTKSKVKPVKEFYNVKALRKEFPNTENYNETGYIMPNGDMLDFSGSNQGGTKGDRGFDHREISRHAINKNWSKKDKQDENKSNYKTIHAFMKQTGAIRFSDADGSQSISIDFIGKLTPQQYKRLKNVNKEAFIDIENKKFSLNKSKSFRDKMDGKGKLKDYVKKSKSNKKLGTT